jgi:hypothetical protein
MNRSSMSWLLMAFACFSGVGACAVSAGDDSAAIIASGPNEQPLGVVLVSNTPKCTDAVGPNQSFNCLVQAWGNPTSVNDMRTGADNCGCVAEVVDTNVIPEECGVQRVAAFCPGTPPFNAVSPIPAGDYTCTGLDNDGDGEDDVAHVDYNSEPPFIGVHIDPENSGRLCDVSLTSTGPKDRTKIENCGGCHANSKAKWSPTVEEVEMVEMVEMP